MKLYYHEDGRLLYSRQWPEVPTVKRSIYADEAAMRSFQDQMQYLLSYPVIVTNPDKAFMEIVWSGKRVKRGEFYEINNCFEIKGNTVTIL